MNALKICILFLEQREELLRTQMSLVRYRNEDPRVLDARITELQRVVNAVKLIDRESK